MRGQNNPKGNSNMISRGGRRNHSNRRMSGNKPMRRQPLRNTRDGDRFYGNKPVTGTLHDCVKCYGGSNHSCHACDHFLATV